MTAPTSPKPPTERDLSKDAPVTLDNGAADAGLRTALTKLADKWLSNKDRPSDYQDGVADAACAIRALLAAHPADAVSDTRREDVARALSRERLDELGATERTPTTEYVRDFYAKFQANLDLHPGYDDEKYDQAEAEFDRFLAAHEAELRERIAQDIARAVGEGTASDIARGATR